MCPLSAYSMLLGDKATRGCDNYYSTIYLRFFLRFTAGQLELGVG